VLFLLNHTEEAREVAVPSGKKELLTGEETAGSIELAPYGVSVISL
jgi:hypothetical protein